MPHRCYCQLVILISEFATPDVITQLKTLIFTPMQRGAQKASVKYQVICTR